MRSITTLQPDASVATETTSLLARTSVHRGTMVSGYLALVLHTAFTYKEVSCQLDLLHLELTAVQPRPLPLPPLPVRGWAPQLFYLLPSQLLAIPTTISSFFSYFYGTSQLECKPHGAVQWVVGNNNQLCSVGCNTLG